MGAYMKWSASALENRKICFEFKRNEITFNK